MSSPLKATSTVKDTKPVERIDAVEELSMNRSNLRQLPTAVDSPAKATSGRLQSSDRRITAGQHRTNTFSTPFISDLRQHKGRLRENLPWKECRLSTLKPRSISTTTKNSLNR
jgi:hypothetical protein